MAAKGSYLFVIAGLTAAALFVFILGVAILVLFSCGIIGGRSLSGVSESDLAAACVNVTRQADARTLTIFAFSSAKPRVESFGAYSIEIVASSEVMKRHKPSAGAYVNHHNGIVFDFAADQIAEGDRKLGFRLAQLIAEADPDFHWSAPMFGVFGIREFIDGVSKDDARALAILAEAKRMWAARVKSFGKPSSTSEAN